MRGMSKKDALACQVSLGLFAGLLGIASTAHGAPIHDGGTIKGDSVKAGHVTLNDPNNATNIASDATNNVIGWKDFSIKKGETVQFDGNNYLNIVTGNVTSHIDGEMKGGNNVYIANTHGVIFGKEASVNVGNLYVTTQDLTGVDYSQPANSSKIGNGTVIDTPANGKAASSAKADVVSLVDNVSGKNLKAAKIVLEGRSVRIMNDKNIQSSEVYTLANTDPLKVEAGGEKEVRPYTGYVHVGHANFGIPSDPLPTVGSGGKYKNLTQDNLYKLIGSESDLDLIETNHELNKNFMLREDITLTGTQNPIGTSATPFTGKFDGMFHTISGLTFGTANKGTSTEYVGLFGTTNGATIMNVGLKNADLSHVEYGGGLVGHAKGNTVISAVYNESTTKIGADNHAGGLVGWLDGSSLDNAYNTAEVTKGGGLVGQFDGKSRIYAVYNEGKLSGGTAGVFRVLGNYVGSTSEAFVKDAYTTNGATNPAANNDYMHGSYVIDSTSKASLVVPSGTAATGDAKQATTYAGWDISDEGGANKTWRIFAGQSTPLLTAFMKGTVQAEYSYADFQQANHGHSDNIASGYTVQAADKQTDGSYVKRPGTESNGGKDITRTYNADYLRIAHKSGDNYTPVTSVDPTNDHDIKLYGAKDRSLVELNKADSQGKGGGGRRNAGKEAMLVSGQHGYDIAGANVTIDKRKVIGDVGQMGKIQREYDGTANAGDAFKAALTAGNVVVRTEGLVDGDGATMTINTNGVTFREKGNWTSGAALSPNAGYNKSIYVDSSKVHFGNADGNYEFDATKINDKKLTGNILQKTIKAKLTTDTGINKTYDGTSAVIGAAYQPNPNLVLDSATPLVASGDVKLNQADVTAKYKTKATNEEAKNAGAHDVAYEGVKLTSTTPGMTKNYKLVDQEGNVLYREAIDDDPNAAAAVTSGGTLWGKGTIARRKLDVNHFSITGASKEYDGKDYLLVDGTEHKVEVAVDANAGTATDTQKGLVEKDKNNLQFTISATDGKAYYKNASNANTKDVYSATSPNGAQFLSYTLKASGSALENYAFEDGATTKDLTTTDTYDIKNTATIKPRTITLDLLKKTGIDKVYDGNANVKDENKVFGTNFGYAADATDKHKLVAGDGASITATAAVYKKKASGLEAGDKDVSRTATGDVIEDGKDVEYKIGLAGTNAATNYRLKYGTSTTNGGATDTVTMTGTGKITPKKLTLTSTSTVTRGYNGGSDASASLLDGKHTLDGKISSDTVALNTGTGTTITGTYYKDATKAEKAVNRGTGYTVAYTGISKALTGADSGNYEIDDAFDVLGDITKMVLTKDNLKILLKSKVTKTYDANERAEADGLRKLTVDGTELKPGIGYEIERANSVYYNTLANTGDFKAPNANAQEDDGATLHAGAAAYGVKYKIKLLGDAAGNYELGNWTDGNAATTGKYTVDGNRITFEQEGVGYIQSRKMYVSLSGNAKNPEMTTKSYDGTTKLILQGATSGDPFLSLGNGGQKDAGFATKDDGLYDASNISTGAYQNRNAGVADDKVLYTPKVTGVQTNYVFYHAPDGGSTYAGQKWDAAHAPLTGKGTITQADLLVKAPTDVRRQYNGDTNVDAVQGKLILATQKKHESAPGADDANRSTGVLDDVQLNEIDPSKDGTGAGLSDKYYRHYNAADVNVDAAAQDQAKYVTYRRIKLTGTDAGNYRLVYAVGGGEKPLDKDADYAGYYTMTGKGIIEKRQVNKDDFRFDFAGVKKVYDGDTPVKYDNDSTKAANYITKVAVDLGGTIGEKSLGYTLVEANYLDKNVAANSGTGDVTYKLKLNDDLLKNYDFADLDNAAGHLAGYSYDSANNTVTRTLGVGTITKRPVYAHVVNSNVTKTYNAKKDVIDESGAKLSGDQLVTFDNVKNGVAQAEAGLVKKDNLGNATTASYTEKKAGDQNRTIDYTLALSGNSALFNNYELQDENGHATLTTHTNTINRRALRLKADAVTKVFDNTPNVKVGGVDSPNDGLHFFDGNDKQWDDSLTPVQDDVKIDTVAPNVYAREYKSKNATRTEEDKKNNVNYTGIKLTGADAANYYLADSEKNALQGNDTAGYTMTGDGEITPFQVTRANFNLKLKDLDKTYDGNAFVKDGTPENPAGWKTSHINKSEITDGSNNHLYDLDVDKVASATYRNAADTADDKNVDTGKKVLFKLKFTKDTLNNFDFDALKTADANGSRMIDGVYHAYDTGKITPKDLRVKLDGYARKAYDGTADVKDVEDRLSLVKEDIVSGDEVSLGSSKGYYQQGTAAGSPKVANANIAPAAANANGYDVAYTVQSDGADRNNYRFINAAGGTVVDHNGGSIYAKGDIERRKLYASTKPVEKTYNADTDVRIKNAPANANDLVEFHDAEGKKDAVFTSGSYGTNATTAAYVANPAVPSAAASDASDTANKWVKYTLKIDGKDAGGTDYANNYVVYDAVNPNTVVYNKAAGTNLGLTTTDNKIDRAPLYLTATHATKQYDGTKTVKKPETLLNITGGWQGGEGGNLNRTGTGSYTAEYQDANVNTKGGGVDVEYKNVKIVGTGTKPAKASNYYLSYNGAKLTPSSSEAYELLGTGDITKRHLTGGALKVGFKTDPIRKYYDGTAGVKSPAPKTYVNNIRATYKDENDHDQTIDVKNYTVERADYLAKSADAAAKDVGKGKDVKFQFALNDGNFDYSGVTGATLGADGVYRFSQNYDRDAAGVGRGEIIGRRVALTLHLVQKVYDGTKDIKNGYYTKDEKTGKLVEQSPNLDWKKVITLDGDGKIGGDENSGFANGEKLDFNATGEYKDANANRDPHYTGPLQPANKDVTYKMRLKDDAANKNYTFQIRVVDAAGNTLKTATSETTTFIDPTDNKMHDGHKLDGLGNIWQKQLTLTKTNGWGKNYDGNANVTDAVKKGLQFDGVAQSDKGFFNFSDPANARANTFAGKLSGRYGDRAVQGSFLDTPGNTAVYKHVKRPQGNLNGTPEARDVELTGVKDAFASLQTPGSVANNYFYDGDNTVYGTGVIKPLTLDLKKTWLKNGADFSKTYDGDPLAKIGGKALSPDNKQAFHDKLKLSVDLGTGEKPIELDYTLYGDEKGDYEGYRPHYENLSGGHAHHGQSDANVKNSADPADTLNKDIVYKLKRINGDKAWANQAEGDRYKDWELSENPSGADFRLSDAATDTHTDNKSGLRAVITPRKVEVQADAYSKIYDGTSSLTAPSLSAGELARKQQELRSKLHVTDKDAAKMLKDDGVDFTVDTAGSHFLNKDSRKADADVARDGKGNVLKDAKGNVLKDGKLVEYRLQKTGDAVKQGNYELPSAALPSGMQTDTVLGTGSITPRIVRVAFDPANTAAPDKIYDGTQYAVKDGKIHSRTFKLVDAAGDEGVVAADAGDVKLNQTHNVGRFASPNVKKDKNGVQAQDVTYHDGIELTNGRNKAGNYKLVSDNLKDSAKITPRPITATLKHEPIVKEYDGTKEVQDLRRYIGKDANGKDAFETKTAFREGNINLVDKNAKVTGIFAPAQPTWEAKDKARGMTLTKAEYDNKNVGKNRRVTYDIAMNSDNYMLVDAAGSSLMSGDRKAQIVSNRGEIDRRKIKIDAAKDANKIYDGTANVLNPLGNLSFNYNGASAEQNEANGLVKGEGDAVKTALGVQGVYRNNDDSAADANAADSDAKDYKNHPVRYTFKKDEEHNPVLANYEITTAKGDNTIYGKGIIRRRTLDVLPDWQATYVGKGGMNFTGHIADGSAQANEGSPLTDKVKKDLQSFNSGVFFYGPKGSVDYRSPDPYEILGWYTKNGEKTLANGNYGSNYTLRSVPSRLFVAPRVDKVVPERTIRPDSKVYERAAFDESNAFGKSKDLNAALAYTGEGVNIGGTKPQQGTSANASAAGIRQQGTGTNIGSSASVSGTAGANGKVQGTTGAANEAARVAGAQPGANVKPQGAQSGAAVKPQGTTGGNAAFAGGTAGQGGYYSPSAQPGASVKPQGTTGGNAALAGGTAGQGGYYSPSAQPGASVKPQGAQSDVAAKPQGAASAASSASRTVGAESVVDRGLAAAAGVSVGSSSDARTGASGSLRNSGSSSGAGSYVDGSSRAADRGLANALGKGVGSAGYYSGKGYSHTDDDEEEEIKKKTKASA